MKMIKNMMCALGLSLLVNLAFAGTWSVLNTSGSAGTWQSLCATSGPSSTWQKLGNCTSAGLNLTIAANTSNYNLYAAAIATGWNAAFPLTATVTINSGVYVGATTTATAAFSTGTGFPTGSVLTLVNNGFIIGAGGAGGLGGNFITSEIPPTAGSAGGPALQAQAAITITNNGVIGGGGGGGGGSYRGGTQTWTNTGVCSPHGSTSYGGDGGGGGAGFTIGAGGPAGSSVNGNGTAGVVGTVSSGGAGGVSAYPTYIGAGGAGGGLGSAGQTGGTSWDPMYIGTCRGGGVQNPGAAGGAAGAAVTGNSYITWTATGTRYGAVQP